MPETRFDPVYAEEFFEMVRNVKGSFKRLKRSIDDQRELLGEVTTGAIDYSKIHVQSGPSDPMNRYNQIIMKIQKKEDQYRDRLAFFADLTDDIEKSFMKMEVFGKYRIVPDILRDEYLGEMSEKDILKKYKISPSTLWRYKKVGFELFDIPNVDWNSMP